MTARPASESAPARTVANPPPQRPLLVYDGDCGFCKRWVVRGRRWLGERVDFAPSQEVGPSFPEIPPEAFEQGIQYIQPDGAVFSNAEAGFQALAQVPMWRWTPGAYRTVPGVRPITEACYRTVANHRAFFSRLDRWFVGPDPFPPGFRALRWIFLRCLALIYLLAFLSFWTQAEGLVGSRGILPVEQTLDALAGPLNQDGSPAGWRALPTVFWWNSQDRWLHMVCGAGVVAAIGVLIGVLQPVGFFLLWFGYLSLCNVGGVFMGYQWDVLLQEAGFLAIFLAPWQLRPRRRRETEPSLIMVWLYRWLSFRLLLGSGLVKIGSRDPVWWPDLTALAVHFETQPLPNPLSWTMHHLPDGLLRFGTGTALILELVIPFFVFLPRRLRYAAAAGLILFQGTILATGNYTFFNLLTMVLCLWWFDDGIVPRSLRAGWVPTSDRPPAAGLRWTGLSVRLSLAVMLGGTGFYLLQSQWQRAASRFGGGGDESWPGWVSRVRDETRPFWIIGSYGLFAAMTPHRPEIVIEGSRDGDDWQPYEFRYKPGSLDRRPPQVAPHQPRLDWQMWFAALGSIQQPRTQSWFLPFLLRILEGSPEVLALLADNPFPDRPPRFVRAVIYAYRFTSPETRRATGDWWARSNPRIYCPPLRLPEADERGPWVLHTPPSEIR